MGSASPFLLTICWSSSTSRGFLRTANTPDPTLKVSLANNRIDGRWRTETQKKKQCKSKEGARTAENARHGRGRR